MRILIVLKEAKMSVEYRSLRGTKDTLPEEMVKWLYVENAIREIAQSYGFNEIKIPTIEKTQLFTRSVGETTDIVQKEMYTFPMGDESITMRPEGTAGTVRAVLQNGLLNDAFPVKLFYMLSCFRHENPQAGRYREFHQFGVECFGSAHPVQDAEVISLVNDLLLDLGVKEIELHLNSIGCKVCRPPYNEKLIAYLNKHRDELCDDCKDRLERNPLRVLDCKQEGCQHIKEGAPKSVDNLCEDCEEHFTGLKTALDVMGIPYKIDPDIVRGLDYYSRTVFEFITNQIGAQGTVCGGGRYDGLVEEMGGPETPALGFGMGLERLIMTMEACGVEFPEPAGYAMYIGSMGDEAARAALNIAYQLRREGFNILTDTMGRSVRAQMKYADRKEVGYSCIIGGNELEEGKVEIRNMKTGNSREVELSAEGFNQFLWDVITDEVINTDINIQGLNGATEYREDV